MPTTSRRIGLVTGGSSGLGRETASLMAAQGAVVIIADRDEPRGEAAAGDVVARGGHAEFMKLDVSQPRNVESVVSRIMSAHGRLDFAVNNAGIEGDKAPLAECTEENWAAIISVNLTGVFYCMKYEIAAMLGAGGGAIVNVGSTASLRGAPRMPAYTAAKHGLVGLTRTAALEYAGQGIRINLLAPGSFRTPMSERLYGENIVETVSNRTPMRRLAPADEVARAIVFLCSESASFITGVALPVDGGKMAGPMA